MYSEAKSTPVRPPGQRATAVTFDPHTAIAPPPCKDDIEHQEPVDPTRTVMVMQLSLTFFLQEGSSGGQWTLMHLRVLEKFYSSVNLEKEEEEEEEGNFSLCNAMEAKAGSA